MKIDMITLHRAQNYGSVLQAFALQKKMEEIGHEVRVLDYYPERYTNKGWLRRLKNKSPKFKNPFILFVAKIMIYPSYLRKGWVFNTFLNKYMNLTRFKFDTNEVAKQLKMKEADAYCTGSDQVWNSFWNEGVEKALFLDFVPKNKLIFSYAASIGLSELPVDEVDIIRLLLDKYEYLSVREDTGVKILHELGRTDTIQCLDPTLLMTKEEWSYYADDRYEGEQYILTYNLHHDLEVDRYAFTLSRKYGIPIWNISYNWHDFIRKGHLCWCPSVEKFLGLIKYARFVIADSFHATVFSIIFERQFVTITPEVASSRVSSILNLLGISERNLCKFVDTSIIETPIDYQSVKRRLLYERQISMNYLRMVTASKNSFTHNR